LARADSTAESSRHDAPAAIPRIISAVVMTPSCLRLRRETYRVLGNVSQGIHNMRSGARPR
jgi:hypothetical protein